jgi:16S rRNA (guanine527-N7)-methyltransferase
VSSVTAEALNVSRETFERFDRYVQLIEKWTPKINLIAKSTLPTIWSRHIEDSLQVYRAGPDIFDRWVDLGSGAGLPGIVVAIMARENPAQGVVCLVESDKRKSAFLRTALRELDLHGEVQSERIEALEPQLADVVSARALADLKVLLGYADRHLRKGGIAIFSKGEAWRREVEEAQQEWSFTFDALKSGTENGSVVLRIGEISRV